MQGIIAHPFGHNPLVDQSFRHCNHRFVDCEERNALQKIDARLRKFTIPTRNLVENRLRRVESVAFPPRRPPFDSQLLPGSLNDVPGTPSRMLARNRGLYENGF